MQLYGLSWPHDDPIDIELAAIRNKGRWRYQGKQYGEGLFHHYKALETQLWPWKRWDPWSELILKSLTENRMTLLSGPANASKTHSVAAFIVCHYLAFPSGACHLVSSTDSRSLELRIWGEIKKLWNEARARYEDTPGRLVESKQMIVTDNKWDKATDYRSGIIGVPCFLSGSLVDTPNGKVPIENIKVGDSVLNAFGVGTVLEVHNRKAFRIVRITLRDGRRIECTPEHPFFTHKGWVKAIDLTTSERVLSANETVRLLRGGFGELLPESEILSNLFRVPSGEIVRSMRKNISTYKEKAVRKIRWSILQHCLRREVGVIKENNKTRNKALQTLREIDVFDSFQSGFLFRGMPESTHRNALSVLWQSVHVNKRRPIQTEEAFLQSILWSERSYDPSSELQADQGGVDGVAAFSGKHLELSFEDWKNSRKERQTELPALVQDRSWFSRSQTCRGDRRWNSSNSSQSSERHRTVEGTFGTWVDSVEILEPRGAPRCLEGKGCYSVYNLAVTGHPSYSVNGALVHNCMVGGNFVGIGKFVGIKSGRLIMAGDELQFMAPAFYDAIANLRKNPGFKFAGMFNPKDRTDVAGKLSEPCEEDGGWEGYSPTGKTMQWRVRFRDGVCLQLDGRDTPNNAAKEGEGWPFPYLINRDDIANDIALYGEDSWQVSSMDYGVFPRDAQARRIITRSMCERFRAQEEPVWSHEPLVTVFCMDAAYGAVGGDRCVGIELAFGKCSDGQTRLAFIGQPMVIPVKADAEDAEGKPIMPEDQIVNWVRGYCENQSRTSPIPLSHIGFDSTGRGSLVAAFARIWGSEFHAIEFGGQATDRPVSSKIQTPCREYYFNYCTQLWFDSATLIVADQCRAMPTSVMEEGCMRGWEPVKDKKVQIEPKSSTTGKPGCKQRMGRSPDLYDSFVVGICVAQKLGFKLGGNSTFASNQTPRWLLELMQQQKTLQKSHRLKYR